MGVVNRVSGYDCCWFGVFIFGYFIRGKGYWLIVVVIYSGLMGDVLDCDYYGWVRFDLIGYCKFV